MTSTMRSSGVPDRGSPASQSPYPAVVVTRPEPAGGPLTSQLRNLGLPVLSWAAIRVTESSEDALTQALERLDQFDWIVFASRHAVAAVANRITRPPARLRVAALGGATAQVLQRRGWRVDLQPDEPNAAALVTAISTQALQGAKVLYPASSRALPTIAAGLTQLGAEVMQVQAYRTESAALNVEDCRAWISRQAVGAVTFASPSAVIELEQALGKDDFQRLLSSAKVIAIGPTTAREVTSRGHAAVLAETATLRGLANTTFRLLQKAP